MPEQVKYLIDELRNRPNFCVSSIDKMPLNVINFLTSYNYNDIKPVRKEDIKEDYHQNNLATLNQIDDCKCFDHTNRAYHMQAAKDMIIGFDIEPRCDATFLAFCANNKLMPAQYREYSMHMGIHLLYRLDPDRLSDNAIDMLHNRTEYKFKGKVDGKAFEFELMMNNHWLTLTRNTFGEIEDLSKPVPDLVYNLVERIAADWKHEQTKPIIYDLSKSAGLIDQKAAHEFMKDPRIQAYKNLTVSDYEDDDSVYEFNAALKIMSQVHFRLMHPRLYQKKTNALLSEFTSLKDHTDIDPELQKKINQFDYWKSDNRLSGLRGAAYSPSHVIWVTSLILEKTVTKREKWTVIRDNMPWLLFVSKKAYDWGVHHGYWDTKEDQEKLKTEIEDAKLNSSQQKPVSVYKGVSNENDEELDKMAEAKDDEYLNDLQLKTEEDRGPDLDEIADQK